jgi:c(7)-type cytochrome triheme protein
VTAHRLLTFIAMLVIVSTALSLPSTAQVRIPPDFQFEGGKDSPGPVTFSHEKHRAKVEKCQACHVKVFKMKKGATGPLTMAKMKAGEQCGACHNGKTEMGGVVPVSVEDEKKCDTCHKK